MTQMGKEAQVAKLDASFPLGAPVTYPFGIRNFYVADPEGNLLETGGTSETPPPPAPSL